MHEIGETLMAPDASKRSVMSSIHLVPNTVCNILVISRKNAKTPNVKYVATKLLSET